MKKRVLIVNNNMHIGGVQKALINLLRTVNTEYDITLLLFYSGGEYMEDIPEGINVISVNSAYKYLGMTKYDVKGHPLRFLKRSFYAAVSRFFGRDKAILIMSVFQKRITGFDVAISYLQNGADNTFYGGCNDFVLKHVDAEKKISVLHCDYIACGVDTQKNAKIYAKYDIIAACSQGCRNSFVKALPQFIDRTEVVRNCHDFKKIGEMASEYTPNLSPQYLNILTVARMGREKGILRAVKLIPRLGEAKKHIRYYIIGDGIEMSAVQEFIKSNDLSDTVILLGEKNNPYPYMKECDLLLISSYSEAAPMVIGESAYLGTPILSTETSSAYEMIEAEGIGWVCDNNDDALLSKLNELILSSEIIKCKKTSLAIRSYDNICAAKQFKSIIY